MCVCTFVCAFVCSFVHACVLDILWGDVAEPSRQKARGHGEAWLDRRGHNVKVFGLRREYDGVAWDAVLSGGPLGKSHPSAQAGVAAGLQVSMYLVPVGK